MNKLMMTVGVVALAGMMTGCQMWKDMQERREREEKERQEEIAKKGPVRYFLEHKGNPQEIAEAQAMEPFDPDWREALDFCVSSYVAAVESLKKVSVIQDGVAVWERALNAQSEKAKKERKDFTAADQQAAYDAVVAAASADGATPEAKKELVALNEYLVWGQALDVSAEAAARKRNADFLKAVVKYTAQAKKIAEKFKNDKLKYAGVVADGLRGVAYLSLAGEAAGLEADVMKAGKDAADHLKTVDAK